MRHKRLLSVLAIGSLALAAPPTGACQDPPLPESAHRTSDRSHPGDPLRVFLMTMGQGDAVWEEFSHNAIVIQNDEEGWARGYNWGVFDFGQVDFIPRLIRGTMLYRMDTFSLQASLEAYEWADREVWLQELNLTPDQRADLLDFVEWNALPENREYRYDYYRDNCSTRVRDVLDTALGGAIRRVAEADTTAYTYRWHTRRLLRSRPAEYVGIQLVLGGAADQPLTGWDELFLPMKLREWVRAVEVSDGDGGGAPLVLSERRLRPTSRSPIPTDAPFALPWFLLVGLLWGGGFLLLARGWEGSGWPRRLGLALFGGGWALAATVFGVLLLGAWAFTDHVFWYRNWNLLQVNPLFLPVPLAFLLFLSRGRFPRWGRDLAVGLAVLAALGLLVRLFPGIGQMNGEILAFTLPTNLSLALGANWITRGGRGEGVGEGSDGV